MKGICKILLTTAFVLGFVVNSQAQSAGTMRFTARANADWDLYTSAMGYWDGWWINNNLYRMTTFEPYFNTRLGWAPNAWVYENFYGFRPDSDVARQHPDWILKDRNGSNLYINFGCWGTGCPLYAFDAGNQGFRQWYANYLQQRFSVGYKGFWLDDVNMDWRVSYGDGSGASPIDPRTGQSMTYDAWKANISGLTQYVRSNLPNAEIVHNALWFAGGSQRDYDQNVINEIQAADYINLERGISDPGLTGGDGAWSVNAFLRYIDHVHSLGKHVIFDEYFFNGEYNVAGYFLINDGYDMFANQQVRPWYTAGVYYVQLGNARGGRYNWNGMIRRDFDRGIVLLNLPGNAWQVAQFPNMHRFDGSSAGWVPINGGQGAILLY